MRINGFSGMDIDSMVKSLMATQRAPLDKLNQQKTTLQWTRDSYRDLNIKIIDAKTKIGNFNKQAAMNTQASTVTGNTSAVKALATAAASSASMSVEVSKMATKSTLQTASGAGLKTTDTTPGTTATLSTTLAQLATGTVSDTYELNINDKTITFSKTDTISAVLGRINSSDANVTASFDEVSGKFSISAKDYGSANELKFTAADKTVKSSTFLDLIHINTADTTNNFIKAANAEVKVTSDGVAKTFTPSENKLTVNGVVLTLMGTTTAGGPATITTQADPTTALNTIKSFVENYNDLISTFNTKVEEQKYRDFLPLTDDQRSNMKENEITEWEKKAKSGLLKNDTILKSTIASMREVITTHIGDLSSVGITTGQYYENGKLTINEDKLKEALQNNPDKVLSIFQGPSGSVDSGIYAELSKKYDGTLDLLVKKAGTSKFSTDVNAVYKTESIMGDQLKNYNSRISNLQDRLVDIENRYYRQFSAMESAMSKLQSQSSSLFGTQA
ncbi:flagellar filament capping protein FliD [Paenibacillus sp. YPG26]|uniref:flagellar filament capping protein FliD n=1 Tax=Paenibacillus sp. YPG26 TaxID=2878915 RepID=UPI00203F1B15|nr:flagellar filament capping protein FliD [Paenibacillus sp. YPG26]USB32832.1 flagellar filament capping protein FliD [Paenibacillus sp. YPG26]